MEKLNYSDHIDHYKKDAELFDYFEHDKFMVEELKRRYQEIFRKIKLKQGLRILEIGTGDGFALSQLHDNFKYYYSVDISQINLSRIKKKYPDRTYASVADIYNIPFADESFDVAIMSEVLEHLVEPGQALTEVYRILKKNGKLVVSVPYKEKISYYLCIHCNKMTPTHAHIHSFNKEKLTLLFRQIGFDSIKSSKNLNKVAQRLYIYRILKWAPYIFWKSTDNIFNLIIDKPISIIVTGSKRKNGV